LHLLVTFIVAASATVAVGVAATALPSITPDQTLGTNGKVREIVQVGSVVWVGGRFTALVDRQGKVVQSGLNNLAALDANTGGVASGVNVPDLTGSNAIVWDLSTDGVDVYAAGKFAVSNGSKNLVEFKGSNGSLGDKFVAPNLKTVVVDGNQVLGGGAKMQAWTRNGSKVGNFVVTTTKTNPSLRGHNTPRMYTDVEPLPGGGWIAACKCDWVMNPGEGAVSATIEKAIVKLDQNGAVDHSWNKTIKADSAAFGWSVYVDTDGVVLAAGGSDYVQKLSFQGSQMWKLDTNGSAQAVTKFGDRYVVGGHFRCVGNNVFHPRLVALTFSGARDPSWIVPVTPKYNGIWAFHVSGNRLWLGGEFKKLGGSWTPASQSCSGTRPKAGGQTSQYFLGRLS
jgi:hypothetical protein